jgi:hypothetical protein
LYLKRRNADDSFFQNRFYFRDLDSLRFHWFVGFVKDKKSVSVGVRMCPETTNPPDSVLPDCRRKSVSGAFLRLYQPELTRFES